MRLSIAIICFGILFAGTAGTLQAQSQEDMARSGSIYSYLGLGNPVDQQSPYAAGMGQTGVAIYDGYSPSLANPAHWGSAIYTQASGGLSFTNLQAKDYTNTVRNSMLTASHFQAVFPVLKQKLGFSLSMTPMTRSDFRTFKQTTLTPGQSNDSDTLTYAIENRGNGGLNRMELGVGWRVNKNISLGYAASLYFGPQENQFSVIYSSNKYQPIYYTRRTTHTGFGNRAGFYLTFPKPFSSEDQLNIAATVNLPVHLRADRKIETDRSLSNTGVQTVTLRDYPNSHETYPMEINAGINYYANRWLNVSGEMMFQQWSDYENYEGQNPDYMTDRLKLSLGARARPGKTEGSSFFNNFRYSAGVSYDSGYLKLNDQQIETLLLSAGIGILSPKTRSSVNLVVQYGYRGTTANNLVKERIWGLKLSVNLAELMFYRPKLQ